MHETEKECSIITSILNYDDCLRGDPRRIKWLYHHCCGTSKECYLTTLEDTQDWTVLANSHEVILIRVRYCI